MSMPFYVSPEQLMKDRADFARKGIARGRSVAVLQYADGIVFVSENPSAALHKISEIYDRIAFAGVGKYNEFDQLRIAGVRAADLAGGIHDGADEAGGVDVTVLLTVAGCPLKDTITRDVTGDHQAALGRADVIALLREKLKVAK